MIDARLWEPPSPSEVRELVHGVRNGRNVKDTCIEVGARLGVSRRIVFYWMSPKPPPGREIAYCEWLALMELVEEMRAER